MRVLRETTNWEKLAEWIRKPNHVYLEDKNFILGYQKYGYGEPIYFKTRLQFDKRFRKFIEIPKTSKENPFRDYQK